MDRIGEQIKNLSDNISKLINDTTKWLEETEPEEEDHDRL